MRQKNSKIKAAKLFASLSLLALLAGCNNATPSSSQSEDSSSQIVIPALNQAKIEEDAKFHSANLPEISQSSFEALGFALGDSCTVSFSNGKIYDDVPYYNGYYVKNGAPVIVAYPGNSCLLVTLSNVGIWEAAELSSSVSVTITLKEKGKYLTTQEALSQSYSLDRSTYSSDEEFSNFRSLKGGRLKENLLYRGASPFDNSRNRAEITDSLLEKNGIKTIVDLADDEEDMVAYKEDTTYSFPYSESLYETGSVVLLGMGAGYSSTPYMESVAKGVRHMLDKEGPYYIHCMEGKDRTGFVCTLFESLAGASYTEMRDDYMKTYENYYKVNEEKEKEKYEAIVSLYFDSFCEFLHEESDVDVLKKASYVDDAKAYLTKGGLTEAEISSFQSLICE